MRQLGAFVRLWTDTRARLPPGAWSWPLLAAAGGAAIVLVGTAPSDVSTASNAPAAESIDASIACQEQTWPYLSDACLQRNRPAGAQRTSHVRVLDYDPAMARAAIGATPWAPKEGNKEGNRPTPSRQKQARRPAHDQDRCRTVTVRSGRRNAEPERVYNVPADAYSAYGHAPRRY